MMTYSNNNNYINDNNNNNINKKISLLRLLGLC